MFPLTRNTAAAAVALAAVAACTPAHPRTPATVLGHPAVYANTIARRTTPALAIAPSRTSLGGWRRGGSRTVR